MTILYQTSRPTTEPNKDGLDPATDVAIQRRVNELHREFINTSAKNVDRWLTTILGVLAFITIVAGIAGYISWEKLDEIAEKGEKVIEELEKFRDQYRTRLAEYDAERVAEDLTEATRTAEGVQRDPEASVLDRARADAVLLQQQGNIEEAIEKWRAIVNVAGEEEDQLRARAWFSIGYLLNDEELEEKLDAYTKAIGLNPTYFAAYNNRGLVRNDIGLEKNDPSQHEAALADYDRALRLRPNNAVVYNNIGKAKNDLGDYQAALTNLDRAIELNRTLAAAYNNRGIARTGLGLEGNDPSQHEAALADYDRAMHLDDAYAHAYNNRGLTKEILNDIDGARADYQQSLALAQEAGDENLVAKVKRNLSRLDNNEGQ